MSNNLHELRFIHYHGAKIERWLAVKANGAWAKLDSSIKRDFRFVARTKSVTWCHSLFSETISIRCELLAGEYKLELLLKSAHANVLVTSIDVENVEKLQTSMKKKKKKNEHSSM